MKTESEPTLAQLQSKLIYAVIVAGKSAEFTNAVVQRLGIDKANTIPFEFLKSLIASDILERVLIGARTGNYIKLAQCIRELVEADIDLRTCAPEDLEKIHGIGPKTSRFFILWTRPGAPYAALDVHVLRWMRQQGYDAPKSTPNGAKYRELEKAFLREAEIQAITPRELDHKIWFRRFGCGECGLNYAKASNPREWRDRNCESMSLSLILFAHSG